MKRRIKTTPENVTETSLESANESIASALETQSAEVLQTQHEATGEDITQASEEAGAEVMAHLAESETVVPGEGPTPAVRPAIGEYVSKAVYGMFYYVSYGVVFSSLMVAQVMPMDNVMGRAIKDGAAAAKNALQKREEAAGTQEPMATDTGVMSA